MADYSTASSAANSALTGTGELVEEYEVGPGRRRVKRGKATEQVAAAAMLEGLAARRAAGGLLRVAKTKDARK